MSHRNALSEEIARGSIEERGSAPLTAERLLWLGRCTWGERGGVYHRHGDLAAVGGCRCRPRRYPTAPGQRCRQGGSAAGSADGAPPPLAVIPGGPPHPLGCPAVRARFAAALETVRDTRGPGRSWVTAAGAGSRRTPLYRCAVQRQGCSRELRERRWEPAAGLGGAGIRRRSVESKSG